MTNAQNQIVVSSPDQIKTFFDTQDIQTSNLTINRLNELEKIIGELTEEEERLSHELTLVRYQKGEAIAKFIENMPRGFWTNWLIFKIFGKVLLPSELNREEKRKLETHRTRLDNYKTLFYAVNYCLKEKLEKDGISIPIEEFLQTSAFAALGSSIWYRLGRNIESIQKEHFQLILGYIEEGNTLTIQTVTNFQKIIKDSKIEPAEKQQLISKLLSKEVVINADTINEAKEEDRGNINASAINVEYTSVPTAIAVEDTTNQNTLNIYDNPNQEIKTPDFLPPQTGKHSEGGTPLIPPGDAAIISVLRQEIENLVQKNERLIDKINNLQQDLDQKELIIAQKDKDIEQYELDIYELRQNTESVTYSDMSNTELLKIAQKSLATEEDIKQIANLLNIPINYLSAGKLRKEVQSVLIKKISEEEHY